ncbi:hypothetical protein Tco_0236242 [Tanacetum coccineum]
MKMMQFFMGLDDTYMQIRSSILSRETLPDVRSAYATISSEESHRVSSGSIVGSSQRNQASAFVSNLPNGGNFKSSDVEDSPVNDRFANVKGMHASKTSESDAETRNYASCESNSSVETLESIPKPVVNEPKTVSAPKVWSDAPIIEEYESDNDDEYVQTVKEQDTCSQNPKVDKRDWNGLMSKRLGLGYGFTRKACFVCGSFSHLIRDCDFHEKRMTKHVELNKQKGKGTGTGENRLLVLLGAIGKLLLRPQQIIIGDPKDITGTNSPNTIVDQTLDNPHTALKNKGCAGFVSMANSGCSRHMTRNKDYLVEYQDYNGGHVAFGGSKGQITGKGKISTGKLDSEDVYFVKEL